MSRTSSASATWSGGLQSGSGHFEAGSGAFRSEYSFPTRFGSQDGSNPEELIAAAHAACFSMALAAGLEKAGTPSEEIATTAKCTLEVTDGGPRIASMQLNVRGRVHGIDQDAFQQAAHEAKNGCPVSGALRGGVHVDVTATLET